jgi:hypothetical protein
MALPWRWVLVMGCQRLHYLNQFLGRDFAFVGIIYVWVLFWIRELFRNGRQPTEYPQVLIQPQMEVIRLQLGREWSKK